MDSNLDIYIYPETDLRPDISDNKAIAKLRQIADGYSSAEHGGNRKRIHLILRNQTLVNILRHMPLESDMADSIELYAYTMEDLWSMEALGMRLGADPVLDRTPILAESESTVHLVIFGTGTQAESLAIHTALISHYPNYCRNNWLRTRITWVSDNISSFERFKQQYRGLMDNSYRRNVIVSGNDVKVESFVPKYADERKDFVDIEWEFVESGVFSDIMSYKLNKWATDTCTQLTIAFCHEDDNRNINEALTLHIQNAGSIPVLVKVNDDTALDFLKQSGQFSQLKPIGMTHSDIASMTDFIHMAQCVNYAYCNMRETTVAEREMGASDMAVALEVPSSEELQRLWNKPDLTTSKRWSNIYNAITLNVKMRSLGINSDKINQLYAISQKEIETMAAVEHYRWCVEELILGYIPTDIEEHKAILADINMRSRYKAEFKHDDLRSISELTADETGLTVTRYDKALTRSLPLIAYAGYRLKSDQDE